MPVRGVGIPFSDLVSTRIPCIHVLLVVMSCGHQGSAISVPGEPASSLGTVLLIAEVVATSRGCHGLLSAWDCVWDQCSESAQYFLQVLTKGGAGKGGWQR